MNIYQKLNAARVKFHSLKLEKTGHNKFAGYKYFELGDFLIPALKVFDEVGLCAVVSFEKELACMRIIDAEKPLDGNGITITSPMGSAALKGCHEVQNVGAVETYQRRYLWVAALEIVEHDAIDATTGAGPVKAEKFPSPAADVAAEAAALMDAGQIADLEEAAFIMIEAHKGGKGMEALKAWRSLESNEEKAYVWNLLASESKLRSFIKANNQAKETA